jgi:phosphoglycolate phosphatase-like HAD superfamily hydrolase
LEMPKAGATRLEKQRERQRDYRARLKEQKRPSRDDVARALLHFAITENLRHGRVEEVNRLLDRLVDDLTRQGFDERATEEVLDALVEKYRRGWDFQRKRHLEPGQSSSPDNGTDCF